MQTLRRFLDSKSVTRIIEYAIIAFGVATAMVAALHSLDFG
jgi:Flp pilus assembly pilin Flp